MGLGSRIGLIFKSKANKALDRAEDPRETLDYSYEKQLDLLAKVRRGVADVATSRKRLEIQMSQLQEASDRLHTQAEQAVAHGRDDLAREALTRRANVSGQLADLQTQHAQLQETEEKLVNSQRNLQLRIDAFRTKKETIKAQYSAAEAQTKIGEAFSGVSGEFQDVGLALQRAEDKTAQMQARASAIDELLASGALDDPSLPAGDDIQRELDSMGAATTVDNELASMKTRLELPAGQMDDVAERAPKTVRRRKAVQASK